MRPRAAARPTSISPARWWSGSARCERRRHPRRYKKESMNPLNVLNLPDWEGCGPDHWQALWARRHGYAPVDQHDWSRPLRGDWLARLEDAVLTRDKPCVLVAHASAASSRRRGRRV